MASPVKTYATEHQFQAACVLWFHNTYHAERGMLHCNDNNSYNQIEGNKKKALGVVKGVADLELIVDRRVIFIELKLPGKKQSQEQIDFEDMVLSRGHLYFIVETLLEFQNLVKEYL